ncbi:MAG TPA: apolipoprotein N-acyltransferase [Pyrinomonadaceae bacterium]|nr:apolipoprotein N-acyltransferase [Pyrinomonadaceae bacterium]
MQEAVSTGVTEKERSKTTLSLKALAARIGAESPTRAEWLGALTTSVLLILSFPDFSLAFLAWFALVPLLIAIVCQPSSIKAFILGWASGGIFFYVSCYWLTYSMIHYGGLPVVVAYLLLLPGGIVMGLFPAGFAAAITILVKRWGAIGLSLAPFIWSSTEWLRLETTGQLWNALGYSQAGLLNNYLIQPASWGGVYAVGFLILCVNAAIALIVVSRTKKTLLTSVVLLAVVAASVVVSNRAKPVTPLSDAPSLYVVAVQPNVPMNPIKTAEETNDLLERHITLSKRGLAAFPNDGVPRLVIWPESPMNFTYASDKEFQTLTANFTTSNHTSLILNSLEPAPNDGGFNSALLINEEGRLISQYDKIRLLPFGEYVPLPQWLPGASLIRGLVGDFTPGTHYTVMPVGSVRAGVFICIESAYPSIARRLSHDGAGLLINISNDGYLGPTAVMKQHLSNAVFRAVENRREILRVTNSGITADITTDGLVQQPTEAFQPDVRTWKINATTARTSFYTHYGDVFVVACLALSLVVVLLSLFEIGSKRQASAR